MNKFNKPLFSTTPQADGSLNIKSPDINTVFDMGNKTSFATLNGIGGISRFFLTEGFEVGECLPEITINGNEVIYTSAKAIGRLWEIYSKNHPQSADLTLSTFMGEESSALYQRISVKNNSESKMVLRVVLNIKMARRSIKDNYYDQFSRFMSNFSAAKSWWSHKGSKVLLPHTPESLRMEEDKYLMINGSRNFIWGADIPPIKGTCNKKRGKLEFEITIPPGHKRDLPWIVTEGDSQSLIAALEKSDSIYNASLEYADWLNKQYRGPENDHFLRSLYTAGLNAAVAMYKELPGGFSGLLAGPYYAYPPRLYFRDGYWTAQILMTTRPDIVRNHILSLARGIHQDGSCPSGVFSPHILKENKGIKSLDWLPDHYDSPSYFILIVYEYIKATEDWDILNALVSIWPENGKASKADFSIWDLMRSAAEYLTSRDGNQDGLLEKPYKANDWADNVNRSEWVTYDQALYAAALYSMNVIAQKRNEIAEGENFLKLAKVAHDAMNSKLWDEKKGHYINYKRKDFTEDNFSIDTLVTLRYRLADDEKMNRVLASARILQTRFNKKQEFGDWGCLSVFPFYSCQKDLFDKSAELCHYHNGSDWPYWDGVYAEALFEAGDSDWEYVLRRWWEYSLEQGWLTPVEYYSPSYKPGGMLQGWSSMPAVLLGKRIDLTAAYKQNILSEEIS